MRYNNLKLCWLIGVASLAAAAQPATPPPAVAQPGPPATIYGRVIQVLDDGLLVSCEELRSSPGYAIIVPSILYGEGDDIPERVLGLFYVTGHPRQHDMVDDSGIAIVATQDGIYRYESVNGGRKTIRKYAFKEKLKDLQARLEPERAKKREAQAKEEEAAQAKRQQQAREAEQAALNAAREAEQEAKRNRAERLAVARAIADAREAEQNAKQERELANETGRPSTPQNATPAKPSVSRLNLDQLLNDCFEKQLSESPFITINGKPLTSESVVFKEEVFNRNYKGQRVRYDCVCNCAVGSLKKDGTAILKIDRSGSPEIIVTPRPTARDTFRSLKKGDKVAITAVIQGLTRSKLSLADAEIIQ